MRIHILKRTQGDLGHNLEKRLSKLQSYVSRHGRHIHKQAQPHTRTLSESRVVTVSV